MAQSYFARSNYRFLPNDQILNNDSIIFELDESEVWDSTAVRSQSPELRKPNSRISRKQSSAARGGGGGGMGRPASLPVNVPDWSKILKDEYRENRRRGSDEDDCDEEEIVENEKWIPPHEFLARNRIASLSVHEGIGRTLKGRDLSRLRNAIWQKTGFED